MKKYLFLLFAFFTLNAVSAQSKIAHLNSQEVMASMSSYNAAVKKLEAFQYEIGLELQAMQQDYEANVKKLQEMIANGDSPTLIEIQRQKVIKKEEALIQREQSAQAEIEAYSRELNGPIVYMIETAVKTVSEHHGYDYVFDRTMLMRANGPDITKEVIEEVYKLENMIQPEITPAKNPVGQ
jgi:outer membrane protein